MFKYMMIYSKLSSVHCVESSVSVHRIVVSEYNCRVSAHIQCHLLSCTRRFSLRKSSGCFDPVLLDSLCLFKLTGNDLV